jgi:hypothetical protein
MPRNTHTTTIQLLRERREDSLGQFFSDVAVHVVPGVVGSFGGVDVEACARAEVVGVVFALDVETAL